MEKKYYYGNPISDYGLENGYVDYATFASAFNCVLNNEIISSTYDIGYWNQVSGQVDNSVLATTNYLIMGDQDFFRKDIRFVF